MTVRQRLLLGPGPSPVSPRVMRSMAAPVLSHLDPGMMSNLDDLRAKLAWVFGAPEGAFCFAVSGTGTSGMEAAVANLAAPGTRALALASGLDAQGLSLLPPPAERLWTLNAVRVPEGIDEAHARRRLLAESGIEIGAGLGPLAGKIWRVGLMGSGSTRENVSTFLAALATALS